MSIYQIYEPAPDGETTRQRWERWERIYLRRAAAADSENLKDTFLKQARMYKEWAANDA